ncbi:MAG: glycoside hydrolase family 43 protein [Lachnospirales bacterium]
MNEAYLFVHFREKTTPDGEQIYFGVSRDGFNWEEINGGKPILWCFQGEKGGRDFTIIKNKHDNKYYIWGTDLSLAYNFKDKYENKWSEITKNGSKYLSMWKSDDLVNWSEQRIVKLGTDELGCLWAPDIIYDSKSDDYIIHWSSSRKSRDYRGKCIYYSRTKDFNTFTDPELLYEKENDGNVIDSAIYEENGYFYMFLKSEGNPEKIILVRSKDITGDYTKVEAFDKSMEPLSKGQYEAPTAVKLIDGRWCLFLDYYGEPRLKQGYVPFIADSLASGSFVRSDESFEFPYGFKHGTIIKITVDEYNRLKDNTWE